MSWMIRTFVTGLTLALAGPSLADTVTTKSGKEYECVVLQQDAARVLIQLRYGTMELPRSVVQAVRIDPKPEAPAEATDAPVEPFTGDRIPPWSTLVRRLASQKWAAGLEQIPATVIDTGVMERVPYQSFRCGRDYEVNIYGDPDKPVAVEIGIYRDLLKDPRAKEQCVELIASVLPDRTDAGIARLLNRAADKVVRGDVTIEITPETAEESYGGWWVSVYNEGELEKSRASKVELEEISVPMPAASTPSRARVSVPVEDEWQPSDYGKVRSRSRAPAAAADSGGGSVYVRGYYRKNGTYVRGHTRRR